MDDQLSALLDDADFWVIQKRLSRFNVFEAIGAVNGELRHSNFLAYILSPSRPHGLGTLTLQLVLRAVLDAMPADDRPVSTLELLVGDLDDAVVHRERDSIDLLIEIDDLRLIVVIENKIHAKAGEGQLRRYREIIEARYPDHRKLYVFLTPDGHSPDDKNYQAMSYVDLAATLDTLVSADAAQDATKLIVKHYVDMLRKNIVEDDKLRSLAAKLYERHAEALDFIFTSKPRLASLVDVIASEVRACGGLSIDSESASTMRFTVDDWDEASVYRISPIEWSRTGRGLLFEVKGYANKPGRLNVSLIVGPGPREHRKVLYDSALANPKLFVGLVKPMGVKWATIFSRDLLTSERAATMSGEAQVTNARQAWSDFQANTLPSLIRAILGIELEWRSAGQAEASTLAD